MKINTELQDSRVIETNITTVLKSHKFSIDNEAAILKNARQSMYKYPIRTLVQEYLSNGRDSCREAKTGFKIDVTLPTSTKLIFKVRDYGVGLSPERVLNVFMKFGKSTKTETDEFTGGFGFGAKSGFAYTDNFTIISTFNGKCYHY
jgi:DNA topoisomerase VI subunit B